MTDLNSTPAAAAMDLKQALEILTRRRHQDVLDAIDAADLFSALLNVLREDVYANQILEIKAYLQRLAKKGIPNALDIIGRTPPHQGGEDTWEAETMGQRRQFGLEANRGRSLSDPAS